MPLASDNVRLSVVQSVVRPVDETNPGPGKRRNLNHMLDLIDMAQASGLPKNILFFHEFPITGFRFHWNRDDVQRIAIEVPGEETEAISKKARQYGCFIVFGSYVKDSDWPGHNLSITTIIGDDGEILARHWKARNIKGVFQAGARTIELMTTTIYNVLDEYVEMYGEDEVIPVTRTKFGNICTTAVQREPELIRAFALKGCELMLRTATGGFNHLDVRSGAMHNGIYTALVNNAHSPGTRGVFGDTGGGGSGIWGPGRRNAGGSEERLRAADQRDDTAGRLPGAKQDSGRALGPLPSRLRTLCAQVRAEPVLGVPADRPGRRRRLPVRQVPLEIAWDRGRPALIAGQSSSR